MKPRLILKEEFGAIDGLTELYIEERPNNVICVSVLRSVLIAEDEAFEVYCAASDRITLESAPGICLQWNGLVDAPPVGAETLKLI